MILNHFGCIFDQFYTTEASFGQYLKQFAPKIGELYGPDPEGTSGDHKGHLFSRDSHYSPFAKPGITLKIAKSSIWAAAAQCGLQGSKFFGPLFF